MKIGIVCFPTYGGSGAVAGELARGLALRGHQIHMISYALPFRLKSFTRNIVFHEVETLNYPPFPSPPYVLSLASRIIEICREYRLDILHLHYAIPHTTSAFLSRCVLGDEAPALITTLHGTDITLVGSHPSYYPITRFSIEQSDGITCVSHYLRDTTEKVFHIDREIEVIYNFVDTARFSPHSGGEARHELCMGDERIIMHISNFRPVKRIFDVIRIFAEVRKERDVKLVLVGDGEERPAALQMAGEMGLKNKVIFLGKQDNVDDIIPCADVLLLPSAEESFGLVALEALSCGVPVVGSDAGGIPEVVRNGENGFLHPPGDVDSMALSVKALLDDGNLMRRFRENGRFHAEAHFKEQKIIAEYEYYYQRILDRKKGR